MNKIILAFTLIFGLCLNSAMAQKDNGCMSKQEFQERQKEFLSNKAGLTKEEADKFFPLYFELQDKKFQYNKDAWDKIKKGKRDKNLTDAEYSKITEDIVKSRITVDELELEYLKKYRKILPAKKIFEIQRAEMRFHRELLKDTKNNRPHNGK